MNKWIRWLKLCGVAVVLAVSLFSAGRPALLTSGSVPLSMLPPAALPATGHSTVVDALQKTPSADTLLLYIPYDGIDGMEAQTNTTVSGASLERRPVGTTSLEEWLAGSAPRVPRLALFAIDQLNETEVIDHE